MSIDTAGYTIVRGEDLERSGAWSLVRRSLGLHAFGMNLVHLAPGEHAPEHNETERDQEEVFVALAGAPSLVIDGERHELPAGTFARLDPEARRSLVNDGASPATVLIASAPRSSGYEPMDWA